MTPLTKNTKDKEDKNLDMPSTPQSINNHNFPINPPPVHNNMPDDNDDEMSPTKEFFITLGKFLGVFAILVVVALVGWWIISSNNNGDNNDNDRVDTSVSDGNATKKDDEQVIEVKPVDGDENDKDDNKEKDSQPVVGNQDNTNGSKTETVVNTAAPTTVTWIALSGAFVFGVLGFLTRKVAYSRLSSRR